MNRPRNIHKVAVVGGGITAWSAAAALKRRIPTLSVELIVSSPAAEALTDRIISTLPSVHAFHHDLGLTDADTISGAASGLRIGSMFEGWSEGLPPFVHAYGTYGAARDGVAFHQLWLRQKRNAAVTPFDQFSPAAELARSRVSSARPSEPIEYGLQLTLSRYADLMSAFATHVGVRARHGTVADVAVRSADGFIEQLVLSDGSNLTADLFVDCSGPAATLFSRLDPHFIDWAKLLPCDRIVLTEGAPDPSSVSMETITALPFGWRCTASSPQRSSSGLVFSSNHGSADEVQRTLGTTVSEAIVLRQGRRRDFWIRNCVAIGDSAVSLEPLEWTNLHLAHSQIDRMVRMMPGVDFSLVELDQFNRESAEEADRVRDFLCLHYVCSRRPEPFWKDVTAITLPPSLEHTLSLFRERGRLPYYQEESFSRDSWLAVLLGLGCEPDRIDPLAELVPAAEAERFLVGLRAAAKSFTSASTRASLADLNPRGIR